MNTKASDSASINERDCKASQGRWGQGEWRWQDDSTAYHDNPTAYSLTSFSQPYSLSQSNVLFLFSVSLRTAQLQTMLVYLFLIPLVTHSLSPDRSLGLGLWHCLSHQMLIGHSGRVWEPENELLTDNSLLCTFHQTKEIEGEKEGEWERENCPTSLWQSSSDFKDIVVLLRKDLFIQGDGSGLGHSQLLFISDSKDENETVLTPTQHQGIGKSRFFQWSYTMIYLFCPSIPFCSWF